MHYLQEREQKGKIGKDFVARLTELKDAVAKDPNHENHQGLTEKIITAQGTIFFVAGFETTSNTLSTLCYRFGMKSRAPFKSRLPMNSTFSASPRTPLSSRGPMKRCGT